MRRFADALTRGTQGIAPASIGDLSIGGPVSEELFREADFLEEAHTLDEDEFVCVITHRHPRSYRDVVAGINNTMERWETSTTIEGAKAAP